MKSHERTPNKHNFMRKKHRDRAATPDLKSRFGLRTGEARLVAMMFAIKALVFLYAGQSYQVFADRRINGWHGWFDIWNRWDSLHYQKLATTGYSALGEMRPSMVFYPLFPWLIRLVEVVLRDYLLSAFLISTLASIATGILLYRLVQLDFSRATASLAVWFLFIFPTSYFLHIGYTESLFLMLTLGCVLAARTGSWAAAGLLGALACLTRAPGLVLVPALLIEAGHQYRINRQWNWQWLSVAIVPLGFVVYLLLNYHAVGDPFAFIPIRTQYYHISLAPPWTGLREAMNSLDFNPSQAQIVGMQECLFIALGLVCTIVTWIKLRPIYGVWMTGNWLLVTSVSFVSSVPRYTLTMFPIFFLFAMLARRRLWLMVITIWSLLYMALFAALFAWGRWAY